MLLQTKLKSTLLLVNVKKPTFTRYFINVPIITVVNRILEAGESNFIDRRVNNLQTKLIESTRNLSTDFWKISYPNNFLIIFICRNSIYDFAGFQ